MKCPFCSEADDKVIDSRISKEGEVIRRRRECLACHRRFTTYERVEETLPLVVKKDGRREPFERAKIVQGLRKACEKRPIPADTIERIVSQIELSFQEMGEKEILSTQIGERVMKELHDLDPVAYVRFASVYREFKDVNDFMAELKALLAQPKRPGTTSERSPDGKEPNG